MKNLKNMEEYAKEGNLAQLWSTFESQKVHSVAHAHAICYSCVAFLVGLAMVAEVIGYPPGFQIALALWYAVGVVLASIGDWLHFIPIIVVGNILFLTATITSFIGIFV